MPGLVYIRCKDHPDVVIALTQEELALLVALDSDDYVDITDLADGLFKALRGQQDAGRPRCNS